MKSKSFVAHGTLIDVYDYVALINYYGTLECNKSANKIVSFSESSSKPKTRVLRKNNTRKK